MRKSKVYLAYLIVVLFNISVILGVYADNLSEKPAISFDNFHVVLAPCVASSTAAYGVIKNNGKQADTLLGISSNAGAVMLHQTKITSGLAQMNHIDEYDIKSGGTLVLKPMSYHLMITNINHDVIKKDGKVQMNFEFSKAGVIKLDVPVKSD